MLSMKERVSPEQSPEYLEVQEEPVGHLEHCGPGRYITSPIKFPPGP